MLFSNTIASQVTHELMFGISIDLQTIHNGLTSMIPKMHQNVYKIHSNAWQINLYLR